MLRDLTCGTILAERPLAARSFLSRLLGLMGRKVFPPSFDALVFENCNSIHCFFMRMEIDVIFVDRDFKVVKCFHRLKPWRLGFGGLKSTSCIELPAGTLERCRTLPGNQLAVEVTVKPFF